MRNWPAVLLLGLTLLPGPAQAQTYRWVDEDGTVHYSQGMDSIPERYRAQARPSVIAPTPSRPDLTEKPPPPSPARPPSPPPSPPAGPPPSPSEREPILEGERQGVLAVLLGVAAVGVWALIVRRRRKRFSARAGDIQKPITPASRDQSLVPHPEMSGPAGGQRQLKCPQCSAHLTRLDPGGGIAVHWCQSCEGTWHDKGTRDEFTRESSLPELLQEKAVFSHPSDRRCPRCQDILEGGGLGPGKFGGDRCPKCEGIWLDAAEKAKLDEIIARCRPPVGRTPGTTDGLTVRFSRTKPILVVLGSLSLVVLVTGAFLLDGGDWRETAWAVSLLGLIGVGLLYVLCRVFRRRLTLIVNREGIVDNTTPFSTRMMRWADIAELFGQGSPGNAQLTLWIFLGRSNSKRRLKHIHIRQTALPMSPGMFMQEIRRYCPETVQIHWQPAVLPSAHGVPPRSHCL